MSVDWYAKRVDRCRWAVRLHTAASGFGFAASVSSLAGAAALFLGQGPVWPVLLVIFGYGFLLASIVLAIAGAVVGRRIKRGRP